MTARPFTPRMGQAQPRRQLHGGWVALIGGALFIVGGWTAMNGLGALVVLVATVAFWAGQLVGRFVAGCVAASLLAGLGVAVVKFGQWAWEAAGRELDR